MSCPVSSVDDMSQILRIFRNLTPGLGNWTSVLSSVLTTTFSAKQILYQPL